MAGGRDTTIRGKVNPMYGISTPPPMIMAGILMGGATSPKTAAMAISEPVASLGIPMASRTGATSTPVVRTQVEESPVIIPGNITKRTVTRRSNVGFL